MQPLSPQLIDVTLRDGSFDFGFDAKLTETLGRLIARTFRFIEIGHGTGMGSYRGDPHAMADEPFLAAAAAAFKGTGATWMMLAQPGYASIDDITLAARYRMPMIRVGFYAEDQPTALSLIEAAKKAGMRVTANYMKSHNYAPSQLAKLAKEVHKAGADIVYIVDSSGSMLPPGIPPAPRDALYPVFLMDYFNAIKSALPDTPLGFHGHNNLGLADANALAAFTNGFSFVDVSTFGMGRSAGNSTAQRVITSLYILGYLSQETFENILDIADSIVALTGAPLNSQSKMNRRTLLGAIAGFHSAQFQHIEAEAAQHRLKVSDIIIYMLRQGPDFSEMSLKSAVETLLKPSRAHIA